MDEWYQTLKNHYGEEFCRIAGYFDEDLPFDFKYADKFYLPKKKYVFQFSGAFFPFHEGHLEAILSALEFFNGAYYEDIDVLIHVDHASYQNSKGICSSTLFKEGLKLLDKLPTSYTIVDENRVKNNCSRNFTRLYSELIENDSDIVFVCGGDRANYALSFIERGRCFVVGRDTSEMYQKYKYLNRKNGCVFIPGNNPMSSTEKRNAS